MRVLDEFYDKNHPEFVQLRTTVSLNYIFLCYCQICHVIIVWSHKLGEGDFARRGGFVWNCTTSWKGK